MTRLSSSAVVLAALLSGTAHTAAAQKPSSAETGIAMSHALPRMNGSHLAAKLVEVRYAPGDSSPPHSHPCPVVGYVIDGSLRVAVDGDIDSVFTAGQTFYEAPNGVHRISANASTTAPVRFLAFFVCDRETPLSTPVHDRPSRP